jgi:hypothetical protein
MVLLRPTIALADAGPLPSVKQNVISVSPAHAVIQAFSARRLIVKRRVQIASAVFRPSAPAPRITTLRAPATAVSGAVVPVAFSAIGSKVRIVASIGPTIIEKTVVVRQRGVVSIQSPKSDLSSRVMMVRVYAISGSQSSRREATVVLVRPSAALAAHDVRDGANRSATPFMQ